MSSNIIDLTHVDIKGNQTSVRIPFRTIHSNTLKIHFDQKNSEVKVYIDPSQILSKRELKEREEMSKAYYGNKIANNKESINLKARTDAIQKLLNAIDKSRHHMLLTWTFHKKHGWSEDSILKDIFAIRSRIIKLFYPNFKPYLNTRPHDFPKMYFFREKHSDGQYHIHLLMETFEPSLLAACLDRDSFKIRWHTILNKIHGRSKDQQRVISLKMIQRWPQYAHHPYSRQTFNQIKSCYDEWKVAKFLCEYIAHYRDGERWGLNHISNSPENNHSKVIESESELVSKSSYLNKDVYFIDKGDDFLKHIIPEYSDF